MKERGNLVAAIFMCFIHYVNQYRIGLII